MKKTFLKPIAIMAFFATTLFSCAGSSESTDTVEVDAEVTESPTVSVENQNMANTDAVNYDEMFESVDNTENYDILALARMNPDLSTFVELVELSGLDASFEQVGEVTGPVTVFIPSNEAFQNLSAERYAQLTDPQNKAELIRVINHHILPSEVPLIQFNDSQIIETIGENEIPVSSDMQGNVVTIGGAQIMKSDIEASNGIIHVVNSLVEPSSFSNVTPE